METPRQHDKLLSSLEYFLIVTVALVPVFVTFPYRVNIFLSWEGAYRLYLGQVPYKDFGLPMGFGYWIIPALFFKLFGPYLMSLVKAQAFINILSGLAFRSILKTLKVDPFVQTSAVLLFCISYSFFNFWPWYNHSVIVFELIAISFLLRSLFTEKRFQKYGYLVLCSLFLFLSFFTKQDGGALAILVCFFIQLYHAILSRRFSEISVFVGSLVVIGFLVIAPFIQYDFFYWFNVGQEPHNSRINGMDFITAIAAGSMWEKFYLCVIVILLIAKGNFIEGLLTDRLKGTFLLLTVGILVQALLFQVTSYTPPDNNIFFHSFAIAYILSQVNWNFTKSRWIPTVSVSVLILFWWSGVYWKYTERIVRRLIPQSTQAADPNEISRSTYIVGTDTTNIPMTEWTFVPLKAFSKVYMPKQTVEGIGRLMAMPEIKGNPHPKVLNMTELTPLAHEMHYTLDTGQPLWYHKGVAIFQKEIDMFCKKIESNEYDVVLFEHVPYLNNFYPAEVRACLKSNYQLKDNFLAPRRPTDSWIEVYVKKP